MLYCYSCMLFEYCTRFWSVVNFSVSPRLLYGPWGRGFGHVTDLSVSVCVSHGLWVFDLTSGLAVNGMRPLVSGQSVRGCRQMDEPSGGWWTLVFCIEDRPQTHWPAPPAQGICCWLYTHAHALNTRHRYLTHTHTSADMLLMSYICCYTRAAMSSISCVLFTHKLTKAFGNLITDRPWICFCCIDVCVNAHLAHFKCSGNRY